MDPRVSVTAFGLLRPRMTKDGYGYSSPRPLSRLGFLAPPLSSLANARRWRGPRMARRLTEVVLHHCHARILIRLAIVKELTFAVEAQVGKTGGRSVARLVI